MIDLNRKIVLKTNEKTGISIDLLHQCLREMFLAYPNYSNIKTESRIPDEDYVEIMCDQLIQYIEQIKREIN